MLRPTLPLFLLVAAGLAVVALIPLAVPADAVAQSRAAEDYLFLLERKGIVKVGTVVQGDVGLTAPGSLMRIGNGAVLADDTVVVADRVKLNGRARVFDVFANDLSHRPEFALVLGTLTHPLPAPLYQPEPLVLPDPFAPENFPPVFPIACGGPSKLGKRDEAFGLLPGTYGTIKVNQGGLLVLGAGTYTFCKLIAIGADVLALGPATVNVAKSVVVNRGSTLVPTGNLVASDLQLNVGGNAVRVGFNSTVSSRIFAPQGALQIGTGAVATGHFVARELKSAPGFFATRPTPPILTCGNGVVNFGETCDPPGVALPPNLNLCRPDCTFCGDGIIQLGEQCDDQNTIDDDSCRNDCTLGLLPLAGAPASPACAPGLRVQAFDLRYTGHGCAGSAHTQGEAATCAGGADGLAPVRILVRDGVEASRVYGNTFGASVGTMATVTAAGARWEEFRPTTTIRIFSPGGALVEDVTLDTSCDAPLTVGDRFGSLEITGLSVAPW